jgi:hypothetical protein
MTLQRVGLSRHDDHPVRMLRIEDPERVTLLAAAAVGAGGRGWS